MPIHQNFEQKADPARIHTIFAGKIGEIIQGVFGEDSLKKMFEEKGGLPEQFKDLPSGEAAVRMNLVSSSTKTALLVAQAATRTVQAAVTGFRLADGKKPNKNDVPHLDYKDPVFKFVGSDKDPDVLKKAQATWQISQMYCNNERQAIQKHSEVSSLGTRTAEGFFHAAAQLYRESAKMLKADGKLDAAKMVDEMANDAQMRAFHLPAPTPIETAALMAQREVGFVNAKAIDLGSDSYYPEDKDFLAACERLGKLSNIDLNVPVFPKASPKAQVKPGA